MSRESEEAVKELTAQTVEALGAARGRIAELEAALRKIVLGPEGPYNHEAGCPFERFACKIAREALGKEPVNG